MLDIIVHVTKLIESRLETASFNFSFITQHHADSRRIIPIFGDALDIDLSGEVSDLFGVLISDYDMVIPSFHNLRSGIKTKLDVLSVSFDEMNLCIMSPLLIAGHYNNDKLETIHAADNCSVTFNIKLVYVLDTTNVGTGVSVPIAGDTIVAKGVALYSRTVLDRFLPSVRSMPFEYTSDEVVFYTTLLNAGYGYDLRNNEPKVVRVAPRF